jgi:hypothetical protein
MWLFPFEINALQCANDGVVAQHEGFLGQASHHKAGRLPSFDCLLKVFVQSRAGALANLALNPDVGVLPIWHYWASASASPMRWKPRTFACSESSSTTTGV